jgi:prephenate dehydrogenase
VARHPAAEPSGLDEALERTGAALGELRALLAAGDAEGLERYLADAREFRRGMDR